MSRRSADAVSAGRVAVVGADSVEGTHLREALAGAGVPGRQVDLFGATRGEAVLSEYAGEARLIQEPHAAEVLEHDVVFLCESSASTAGILSAGPGEALVVDLAGATGGGDAVPVVDMELNAPSPPLRNGVVAVPHGISIILARVLSALRGPAGLRQATAVVLRPAAAFGDAGVEELRDQTVRLFNFSPVPTDTFGRQLSFNLLPQRMMGAGDDLLDRRIADQVRRVLGWSESRLALRLVNAPVFHGHAFCVRVEPGEPTELEEMISAVEALPGINGPTDAAAMTPMEVAEERITTVSDVSEDGMGGFWLWLVSGEVGRCPAEQALRLARCREAG